MDNKINITRFLTRQGVCNDMQNEILSYISNQYWLLYIEKYSKPKKTNEFIYHEIITYKPIDQINLTNVYKFLQTKNAKLDDPFYKITRYTKDEIKIYYRNGVVVIMDSKQILESLEHNERDQKSYRYYYFQIYENNASERRYEICLQLRLIQL